MPEKKKNKAKRILLVIGITIAFFGFWVLISITFADDNVDLGFWLMLTLIAIPLGVGLGVRLASPKKKRRKRR